MLKHVFEDKLNCRITCRSLAGRCKPFRTKSQCISQKHDRRSWTKDMGHISPRWRGGWDGLFKTRMTSRVTTNYRRTGFLIGDHVHPLSHSAGFTWKNIEQKHVTVTKGRVWCMPADRMHHWTAGGHQSAPSRTTRYSLHCHVRATTPALPWTRAGLRPLSISIFPRKCHSTILKFNIAGLHLY